MPSCDMHDCNVKGTPEGRATEKSGRKSILFCHHWGVIHISFGAWMLTWQHAGEKEERPVPTHCTVFVPLSEVEDTNIAITVP